MTGSSEFFDFVGEIEEETRRDRSESVAGPGPTAEPPTDITGRGEAADGLIHATVGSDARLQDLQLDPALLRPGQRGPVKDSGVLAEEITAAVNAAVDDLQNKIRNSTADPIGRLGADLDQVAADFERVLDHLTGAMRPSTLLDLAAVSGSAPAGSVRDLGGC
ncbi:MAG: YbaB/EbfC family nucleoid-associated protein [Pseudonocardiaceae bacterium]